MGIFRTLYREARDLLGMGPPPENATQRAERVAGQVKSDLGGKRTKDGDDYLLATSFEGREFGIVFDAEGGYWVIRTPLEAPGVSFALVAEPEGGLGEPEAGLMRQQISNGLFIEVPKGDAKAHAERVKGLPLSARSGAETLVKKTRGRLDVGDGLIVLTPTKETMQTRSPGYEVKGQLKSISDVAAALEG